MKFFIDNVDIQNIKIEDKIKNILKITHDSHIFFWNSLEKTWLLAN